MPEHRPHKKSAAPQSLIDVRLDSRSLATSTAEIEIERHKTVADLLYQNKFILIAAPQAPGPYRLTLGLQEERLLFQVDCTTTAHQEEFTLALRPLRQHIHDYAILCDSFYKTARAGEIHRLEALDAGRRAIHDESAETLMAALEDKVTLDKATARRLFSLVYVLHLRHSTTTMR